MVNVALRVDPDQDLVGGSAWRLAPCLCSTSPAWEASSARQRRRSTAMADRSDQIKLCKRASGIGPEPTTSISTCLFLAFCGCAARICEAWNLNLTHWENSERGRRSRPEMMRLSPCLCANTSLGRDVSRVGKMTSVMPGNACAIIKAVMRSEPEHNANIQLCPSPSRGSSYSHTHDVFLKQESARASQVLQTGPASQCGSAHRPCDQP